MRTAAWMAGLGMTSSCGSLMVFFGGSSRDPAWMWALYILLFYGGGIVVFAGLSLLVMSAFFKGT